jgi:hypothetical protein
LGIVLDQEDAYRLARLGTAQLECRLVYLIFSGAGRFATRRASSSAGMGRANR